MFVRLQWLPGPLLKTSPLLERDRGRGEGRERGGVGSKEREGRGRGNMVGTVIGEKNSVYL